MAEMLSPGVYIQEIDASQIVPTVSNSVAVFAGNFKKGRVNKYQLITSVDELVEFYGIPTNENYNDWYQAYNFLQYSNKLLVSRVANVGGTKTPNVTVIVNTDIVEDTTDTILVDSTGNLKVGDLLNINDKIYRITNIVADTSITLNQNIIDSVDTGDVINSYAAVMSAYNEVLSTDPTAVELTNDELLTSYITIENSDDFELKYDSIAFSGIKNKLKIIAKNPGIWADDIEIAIAKPADFNSNKEVFEGVSLDNLFEYVPTGTQVGIIIKYKDIIKEIFTVDFDITAKDINNKSTYIENVLNSQSYLVFVKVNDLTTFDIQSKIFGTNGTILLKNSMESDFQLDDLINAYELFENKEEIELDIVIGNEYDSGLTAKNLADSRADCIAFIGAQYADVVGKKASDAVANLISWRTTGELNFNSMFTVACANYKFMYDRYNDKNRWVNIAGDVAGLRSYVNSNQAAWWVSAGLDRGQVKGTLKLAFNPNQAARDFLYKNGLNPIVSFPGQGTVVWGQKTLLDKASSFDRVNVRGLFNTIERSLSKMAKYQVMEFNDNFTRNKIISMIKPFLSSVQAGRGIQDYLVICDESNNTPDVVSRNQLIVDVYIKPNNVAEFILLKFTNAGSNSFAQIIGA